MSIVAYTTTAGATLLNKCIAGGYALNFVAAELGSGVETDPAAMKARTSLVSKEADAEIAGVSLDSGAAKVTVQYSNTGLAARMQVNEIGVYAKDPTTNTNVLYVYANFGSDPDYISPASAAVYIRVYDIIAAVSNVSSVTATISSSAMASQSDLSTGLAGKQAKITASGILKGNGSGTVTAAVAGTDYATPASVAAKQDAILITGLIKGTGSGLAVAVGDTDYVLPETVAGKQAKITANGILKGNGSGTVTAAVAGTDYATPAAVSEKQDKVTATGLLKGNGSGTVSAATAGTDYVAPSALSGYQTKVTASGILKGNGSGTVSAATADTDYVLPATMNTALGNKQDKITASGLLKGAGGGSVSAATAGTDYVTPTGMNNALAEKQAEITAQGILKGEGSGTVTAAVAGTDYAAASHTHSTSDLTDTLPISKGGTNATTAAAALTNLGIIYSSSTPTVIEGGIWLKPVS